MALGSYPGSMTSNRRWSPAPVGVRLPSFKWNELFPRKLARESSKKMSINMAAFSLSFTISRKHPVLYISQLSQLFSVLSSSLPLHSLSFTSSSTSPSTISTLSTLSLHLSVYCMHSSLPLHTSIPFRPSHLSSLLVQPHSPS